MNEARLEGSCLCGEVAYVVRGEARRFYHCHCKRCRKATGTGHASNVFVDGELEWLRGQENVTWFKVPDAIRFGNTFCVNCGSRLPRWVPELTGVMIPAGSLDTEPSIAPQARIFGGSKAPWSCGGDTLPQFDEYAG